MNLACILSKEREVVTSIPQTVRQQSIGWLEFEHGRRGGQMVTPDKSLLSVFVCSYSRLGLS